MPYLLLEQAHDFSFPHLVIYYTYSAHHHPLFLSKLLSPINMETICAFAHGFGTQLLQHGAGKTNTRYSFSTTHKFMPFASVGRAKPSDADDLEIAYQLDKSTQKINLNGEVYCNGGSQPYLFQAVRKSMISVVCSCSDMACVAWRQPQPLGNPRFIRAANELILSKESQALKDKRVGFHINL